MSLNGGLGEVGFRLACMLSNNSLLKLPKSAEKNTARLAGGKYGKRESML